MTALKKSLYSLIQKDESIYNFILDSELNGFWFLDFNNLEDVYINSKLSKTLGVHTSKNSSGSFSIYNLLEKEDLNYILELKKAEFNKISQPIALELNYSHLSGKTTTYNAKALLINSPEGISHSILVTNQELCSTKNKNENVQRYKHIIEGTNIGTWEWNIQTGETIFNEKWAFILGYTLAELEPITAKTWENLSHPEDHQRSNILLEKHFREKTEYYEIESRFKHKNGEWIWVKDNGKVVSWTIDGKPEWMAGSHQNITERKEHEILLEKYKDLLDRTNDVARIGTWEVDLKKNEVIWSDVTKEIHEVPMDYAPKLSEALDFYPLGESRDLMESSVNKAIVSGENYDIEVEITTQGGKRKWVRAIGISEFKNGECLRLYGLFQDIHERKENERLNNERQTLLETILNSIDVGIVSCDSEGNLTLFNKATKEWHGLPAEPISPSELSNYYGLLHVDGKTPLKKEEIPLIQILYTGKVSTKEFIISPKNGNKRNIISNGSQLIGEDGKVFGAVVAMQDITNLKNTEKKLKISEAAFRGNFENAAIGMAILNENTQWLEVNDQLSKIVGYTREELLKLSVFDLTPEEDINKNIETLRDFVAGKRKFLNSEQRFVHKEGFIVYVILSVSVVKNEIGNPLYFIGQITDITPRKIAAQKLQETLAKLEAILDSSTHVSIIGTDLNGKITTFNRGAENLLGYSKEEMVGHRNPAIIHLKSEIIKRGKELSKKFKEEIGSFEIFTALAKRGLHDTREWTYVRKDGVQFPVQLTVTPIKDGTNIIGYLGVAAEISEIKRVEKEIKSLLEVTKDQNDRLKNFAHIVSHNLRSHSGNFAMLLELYLVDHPSANEDEIMKMLLLASTNLKETIAHLNEVVLINTKIDESFTAINLFYCTEQAIRNVAGIANKAKVKIINNIDPRFDILGLQAYLDSILLNFLTNGIKYRSEDRDSFITIESEKCDGYIVISIEDNGLGIDLKKHGAKVFGMYKTFHANKNARGIGLFITKNQIESMGGKIELESEVNKGTKFKISLKYEKN